MGVVFKAALPGDSGLNARLQPGDFLDCYACKSALPARAAAERALIFPGWARVLLSLRNLLVAPLGLKTTLAPDGARIGHFPIQSQSGREILLGFDDSHLDFSLSISSDGETVHGATWVRPHNRLGRAYLAAVMPFHILIMRSAMRRVARAD